MSHKHSKSHEHAQPAGEAQGDVTPAPAEAPRGQEATSQSLQAERDDLLARLQRVSADYVNYQKRVQRDINQAREFANEELIRSLLPVLDDIDRALGHARENHTPNDPLLVGMELVHKKAIETLTRYGLGVISAQGQPFNPELHQALMQQPSTQVPPRTVLQELQKGYQLKGRTIRPAQVVVSKEPEPATPEEAQENSGNSV